MRIASAKDATEGEQQLPKLASYEADDMRRWVEALCHFLGTSSTTLARAAGIAPSTLNRFLNNPTAKHRLSATTIDKIQDAGEKIHAIVGPQTLDARPRTANTKRRGLSKTVVPVTFYRRPATVRVVGRVQAGLWQEAMEWPADEHYIAPMFLRGIRDPKKIFGLEVSGESMNELYPDGSILACIKLYDIDRPPQAGERVIVQRRQPNGLVESTVKQLDIDKHGRAWLVPRSNDPEFQGAWRIDSQTLRGEDIEVVAIVVGSHRPEPNFR
jgi:SOS-response transcriptional repressor LexA